MSKKNNILETESIAYLLLLLLNTVFLIFMIGEVSIYHKEAQSLSENAELSAKVANFFLTFFPSNDYALRLPFASLHLLNCILFYNISTLVLRKKVDAIISLAIYMAIPFIAISGFTVSSVPIVGIVTLAIIYINVKFDRIPYILLTISAFIDFSMSALHLSVFFYGLLKKRFWVVVFSMIIFGINIYIFSPIHGVPKGYFLDAVGMYSLLFSPFLFIYLCYGIYNAAFNSNDINFLKLLPLVGITFTLLISLRQNIDVSNFIVPISCGIPSMIGKMLSDVRSRLPKFAKRYMSRLVIVMLVAMVEDIMIFGNKIQYYFDSTPNFAYSFYGAKEIASQLKHLGIENIKVQDEKLRKRLMFYGIEPGEKYILKKVQAGSTNNDKRDVVRVKYFNRVIESYRIIPRGRTKT